MSNRIFLDTNILIDILIDEKNQNSYDKIRSDIDAIKTTKNFIKQYINFDTIFVFSSLSVANAFFLFYSKQKNTAYEISEKILNLANMSLFEIIYDSNELVNKALKYSRENNTDYEDALQYFCAKDSGCKSIITNDKNFPKLDISLIRTIKEI